MRSSSSTPGTSSLPVPSKILSKDVPPNRGCFIPGCFWSGYRQNTRHEIAGAAQNYSCAGVFAGRRHGLAGHTVVGERLRNNLERFSKGRSRYWGCEAFALEDSQVHRLLSQHRAILKFESAHINKSTHSRLQKVGTWN